MPELNGGDEGRSASSILDSWKEIAAYFRVSVRTVQNWEAERKLPVHRMPGPRGRVYAYTDELERWRSVFQGGRLPPEVSDDGAAPADIYHPNGAHAHAASRPKPLHAHQTRQAPETDTIGMGLWVLLALLVIAGVAILLNRLATGAPARWRVEGDALVMLDSGGRELWQFGPQPGLDGRLYSADAAADGYSAPWAGQLDGAGGLEVLFPLRHAGNDGQDDELICLDAAGKVKWRFRVGGKVQTREQSFSGPWQIRSFLVITQGDSRNRIVLTANHRIGFPAQVALLDDSGRKLKEYWHAGPLSQIHFADFDGDKRGEIYLGGVASGLRSATLVVLDPEDFSGASREINPRFQFNGLSPGREKARLIFGRTELNRRADEFNTVSAFLVSEGELVAAVREFGRRDVTTPLVYYYFGPRLRLTKVEMTDSARAAYRQAASLRLIPEMDPNLELPALAGNVRFIVPWLR